MLKKKTRNCRGITIAEAMVAMTIILVVSASAVTMITAFSKSSSSLLIRNEGIALAENSLECFKAADSYTDYVRSLFYITDLELSISNYQTETRQVPVDPLDPSRGSFEEIFSERAVLSYNAEGYSAMIHIAFDRVQARFSVYVFDENAKSIMAIENYTKAVMQ